MIQDEYSKGREKCLSTTSASQIKLWQACPRKWFYNYVVGLKPEQTAAQRAGTEIDDNFVQPYLRTGEIPVGEWTMLTKTLIPYLPRPVTENESLLIQQPIRIKTYEDGPTIVGFPDMIYKERDLIHVDDLKTTSDFRYSKSADELARDVQMLAYAYWTLDNFIPKTDHVVIAHVYGRRKEPHRAHRSARPHAYVRDRECKCEKCKEWLSRVNRGLSVQSDHIVLTRKQVTRTWDAEVLPVIREMADAARNAKCADDLDPNTNECDAWGGCPHRKNCGILSGNFGGLLSIKGTGTGKKEMNMGISLKDKLAAVRAARRAPEQLTLPMVVANDPTLDQKTVDDLAAIALAEAGGATGVLPPDSPPRTSSREEIENLEASKKKKKVKSEKVQADAVETESSTSSSPASTSDDTVAVQRPVRKKPARPPIIYVDCYPVKLLSSVAPVELEAWLAPIEETVNEAYSVSDYRLIDYKAKGILATAIRDALDTCPPVLVIDTKNDSASIALSILTPYAHLVVRGIR